MTARRRLQLRHRRRQKLELPEKLAKQAARWTVRVDRKDGLVARRAREAR